MNVLMMTNTYAPHVGGVARSVQAFTREFRRRGHRVVVVAPPYDGPPTDEGDVVRVPALKRFQGGDFSVRLPAPGFLTASLRGFLPDVVHAHHPFLLGDTALVAARVHGAPLVFTHHTLYEQYVHHVSADSPVARRFIARFATGFANMADCVFAPSRSVAELLRRRGVRTPIEVVPTGVDLSRWRGGGRTRWRRERGVPPGAVLVGHLGRLSPEKNLDFLARAVGRFMTRRSDARFLLMGTGSMADAVERRFQKEGLGGRLLRETGHTPEQLSPALHAMDVFAFSSLSETQGLVLVEAMACGVPVVALDASGARDIVRDHENGRLLPEADEEAFSAALEEVTRAGAEGRRRLRAAALRTAKDFSLERSADEALSIYRRLVAARRPEPMPWEAAVLWASTQWSVLENVAASAKEALAGVGEPS